MKEKYISDILNYEKHIKPYRLINIFSGVGSGKNTFINNFITGKKEPTIPKKTVLLITSRRARANETISQIDVQDQTALSKWKSNQDLSISNNNQTYDNNSEYRVIPSVDGKTRKAIKQKSVVCTNAFIEYYFREIYNPSDSSTFLWELFDMIVIDEVHSLALDATYQTAPFYVNELVTKTLSLHEQADKNPDLHRPLCEHIILMTGTPNPIKKHIAGLTSSTSKVEYNLFKKCKNIVPENIVFANKNEVKAIINNLINKGKKFIYFSNPTIYNHCFSIIM